jgi:hypothetical protein
MISGNRQSRSPMDRPRGPQNRKVIVNPFTVIVNPAVLNLSRKDRRVPQPICRQFADHSWEFADSAGTVLREFTDNLPIFSGNLPMPAGVTG